MDESDQRFTRTRWSLVLRARGTSTEEAAAALERLCRTYWPPIYGFLRRSGRTAADAQDLTQEFFATLLRRNALERADEARGRFRTFLLACLRNFLRDEHERETTAKRGHGQAVLRLDTEEAERLYLEAASPELGPEEWYDLRWARSLMESALNRLRAEHESVGKGEIFRRLETFLTLQPDTGDYAAAGAALNLRPGTVRVAVHRMRQRCRELLREELEHTVSHFADGEAEFRHLFDAA